MNTGSEHEAERLAMAVATADRVCEQFALSMNAQVGFW